MTTNYDPIADLYRQSKQQPWRVHFEMFSFLEAIGDIAGQTVIDLACGEGFYSRLLLQRGARRVTGIDMSSEMIRLAREENERREESIEYLVGDARQLDAGWNADIVVAAYLLNYARTTSELVSMCQSAARCLKPGGRFVGINCNPALNFRRAPSFRPYGFETSLPSEWTEGAPIRWRFFVGEQVFEIENYYLSPATYESAFRTAGFASHHWRRPTVSPVGRAEFPAGYWDAIEASAPITVFECIRSAD